MDSIIGLFKTELFDRNVPGDLQVHQFLENYTT